MKSIVRQRIDIDDKIINVNLVSLFEPRTATLREDVMLCITCSFYDG